MAEGEAPEDKKINAALIFAHTVVRKRGIVSDVDVQGLREAGYNDAAIAEIIAAVSLNIFTNYFNNIAKTVVDFPLIPASEAVSVV